MPRRSLLAEVTTVVAQLGHSSSDPSDPTDVVLCPHTDVMDEVRYFFCHFVKLLFILRTLMRVHVEPSSCE